MMKSTTTVIVKVTSSCNLGCSYCYFDKPSKVSHALMIMSRETLERVVQQVLSLNTKRVRFIWHGGEPLLANREFYENAIEFQDKYRHDGQEIKNSLQTNATLITPEWSTFFKNNKFSIGISIDGPQFVQDSQRQMRTGKGTFARVWKGIEYLREKDIRFGALAVITKSSAPYVNQIFEFFRNSSIKYLDFLPCVDFNPITRQFTELSITPTEYADFMISLFDLWFKLDDPSLQIRYFADTMTGILGGRALTCKFSGLCSQYLAISTQGDIYHCDKFIDKMDNFGNILETDLQQALNSDNYQAYIRQINAPKNECLDCEWEKICGGGCSYHRILQGDSHSFQNPLYFCSSRKRIFSHINERLQETLSASFDLSSLELSSMGRFMEP